MLKSLFGTLCKIRTLLNCSWTMSNSPNPSTTQGHAASTSGAHSPIRIGDIHNHHINDEIDPSSFRNCLKAIAHKLPYNFRHRGNIENPFNIEALKRLVHATPEIHKDQHFFALASKCLTTAEILKPKTIIYTHYLKTLWSP